MAPLRWMLLCLTGCVILLTVTILWSGTMSHQFTLVPPRSTRAVFKIHKPVLRELDQVSSRPQVSTLSSTTVHEPPASNAHGKCQEKRHVIYVRIPKTGSSTLTFLIWGFGQRRGLKFLLPRPGFEGSQNRLALNNFHLPNSGKYCDLMANHVIYNYENFKRYFPADVVFISLLREPMNQLYSTLYYLNFNIPGTDKVKKYLLNPVKYEPKYGTRSFTHNPMMSYFGLASGYFRNVDKIREKIAEIDRKFVIVLILEKMDESLVLLKRKLCWTTSDILYVVKNKNRKKPVVNITVEDYERLKTWSLADYMLYQHFLDKLQQSIEAQGDDFQQELSMFRSIQRQFTEMCKSGNSTQTLKVAPNKFSSAFKVSYTDCQRLKSDGRRVLADIRRQQKLKHFCNRK